MELKLGRPGTIASEAFGPFRSYILSRGLVVRFTPERAEVVGGRGSQLAVPFDHGPDEFGLHSRKFFAKALEQIERQVGVKLVGLGSSTSSEVAFKISDGMMTAGNLAGEVLARQLTLESVIRQKAIESAGIDEDSLLLAQGVLSNMDDAILDGKIGRNTLSILADATVKIYPGMRAAFFVSNAINIGDDMLVAMRSACRHLAQMNSQILTLNDRDRQLALTLVSDPHRWEIREWLDGDESLADSYTSAIVSCCTALDLLYEWFVYLTRDPFLNPAFPAKLHFPIYPKQNIFQFGGCRLSSGTPRSDLPSAIPNLEVGHFRQLTRVRNDLVHNFTSDGVRTLLRIGVSLPPVNYQPLQYAQYMSIDADPDVSPAQPSWRRRFYQQQTDGQEFVYEWIVEAWRCIFDTTEWLIDRCSQDATR